MGKVSFPLINLRRDVLGVFHPYHYTGARKEKIEVPTLPDEYGYYSVSLSEMPSYGARDDSLGPKIDGFTEVRNRPIDASGLLSLGVTEFFVNYSTGTLLFNQAQAGNTLEVDYWGQGSLMEVEDINNLDERLRMIEAVIGIDSLSPIIDQFAIDAETDTYEVGSVVYRIGDSIPFLWKIRNTNRIVSGTLQITNLETNTIVTTGLNNDSKNFNWVSTTQIILNKYGNYAFELSCNAMAIPTSGQHEEEPEVQDGEEEQALDTIRKRHNIRFLYKIYTGASETEEIPDVATVQSEFEGILSDDIEQTFTIEPNGYKWLFIPAAYFPEGIEKFLFIDPATSIEVAVQEPILVLMTNSHRISTNYYAFRTTNQINEVLNIVMSVVQQQEDVD